MSRPGREEVPERSAGMTRCEMESDDGGEFADPATDLDEAQAEGVEMDAHHPGMHQPAAQRIQQPVDGGMQQQPELVGRKGMTTQAIGEAVVLEILDPVRSWRPSRLAMERRAMPLASPILATGVIFFACRAT